MLCDCFLDCLSKLIFTSIIIDLYEMCLDNCQLVEESFANISTELSIIWNHSTDVLIVIVERENKSPLDHLFGIGAGASNNGRATRRHRGPLEWRMEATNETVDREYMMLGNKHVSVSASPSLFNLTGQTHLVSSCKEEDSVQTQRKK